MRYMVNVGLLLITSFTLALSMSVPTTSSAPAQPAFVAVIDGATPGIKEGTEFYPVGTPARDFVKQFGKPDREDPRGLCYSGEGLTVLVDENGKVAAFCFSTIAGPDPFLGRVVVRAAVVETDRGIGSKSTYRQIVKAYGEPTVDRRRENGRFLQYKSCSFEIGDNAVSEVVVGDFERVLAVWAEQAKKERQGKRARQEALEKAAKLAQSAREKKIEQARKELLCPKDHVVYVLQMGGYMLNDAGTVKQLISDAVHLLGPKGAFNVISFQDGKAVELSDVLLANDAKGDAQLGKYLDHLIPEGESEGMVVALKRAVTQHPKAVVVCVTSGWSWRRDEAPEADTVIELLRKSGIVVNVIALSRSDDEISTDADSLARRTGGMSRHYPGDAD